MTRAAKRAVFLLAACMLYPAAARAENPLIAQAKEAYEILDLEGARDLLAEALANPDNTDADLVEIYKLMGITFAMLGEEEKAQEAFTNMFAIDRDADLAPDVPEQVQDLFDKVRRNLPANLKRPKPKVAAAAKDEPPALEEQPKTGTAGDEAESAEDELASILGEGGTDTGAGTEESQPAGPTPGPKSTAGEGQEDSGGFDVAALEAEAAAALGPGEGDEGVGGTGSGGYEVLEARPDGGGGDVVKIFPPTVKEVSQGSPVEMEIEVDDLSGVIMRLVLYYRQEGSSSGFSSVDGQKLTTGKYFIKIPMIWNLSAGDVLALEYYIEALGAGDQVLGSYGQPGAPRLLRKTLKHQEEGKTVVRKGEKPFYEKAWFWGIIGGVVAAGTAAGLTVAFWPEQEKPSAGALGKIVLQPK